MEILQLWQIQDSKSQIMNQSLLSCPKSGNQINLSLNASKILSLLKSLKGV